MDQTQVMGLDAFADLSVTEAGGTNPRYLPMYRLDKYSALATYSEVPCVMNSRYPDGYGTLD